MAQQHDNEDFDARLAELTEQLVRAWNLRLQAGDKRAVSDLHNVVLDRLTEADAAAVVVQSVLDPKGAESRFQALAADAMRAECENEALKQLEGADARRAELRADDRAAMAFIDRIAA